MFSYRVHLNYTRSEVICAVIVSSIEGAVSLAAVHMVLPSCAITAFKGAVDRRA